MKKILIGTLALVVSILGLGSVVTNAANAKPNDKVVICHVPPGNPENAHRVEVNKNGLKGHLDNNGKLHGLDYFGECKSGPTDPTETPTEPTDNPTTTEPVDNRIFVKPAFTVKAPCVGTFRDWIVPTPNVGYTAVVSFYAGRTYQIEFTANEGYGFSPADNVSDDGMTALVLVRIPVVRCVVPKTPETETRCSSKKCVKITRDGSGKVVERNVINYGNVKEEGF